MSLKMIHISKVSKLAEEKPFDCTFIKQNGDIVHCNNVTCTSVHSLGRTMNLKFPNNEIRKIKLISIIEFNGMEVFI
jgi:hypothetical protein